MRPQKSLSQNFLTDQNIVTKFVQFANLDTIDSVLEIGPGKGAITEEILKYGSSLLAIEKDRKLFLYLREKYSTQPNIEVRNQDILTHSFRDSAAKKWKVISNLPFQLTSPILGQFLPQHLLVDFCLFILQKELADRILAKPKTKLFSHITLFTQFYSEPKEVLFIPRNCFFPKPKVDCKALLFSLKPPPHEVNKEAFFALTKVAFNQKRKMLRKTLPYDRALIEDTLKHLNLSPLARPEKLGLKDWIHLVLALDPKKFSNK